jgi:hypothetical protein
MYESTEKRIVVYIPGAKLLSTRGSGANTSEHWAKRGADKGDNRHGANTWTVNAITSAHRGSYLAVLSKVVSRCAMFVAVDCTGKPYPARRVTFTRICPKRHFCDPGGNLATLFKATEDGVADALGVDDKTFAITHPSAEVQSGTIGVWYEQIDGPWGLRITIES